MKFIKYKQVARITFYGFDDLYRNNNGSVFTEPLNSLYYTQNLNAGVQIGNNAKRMRFQIKGLDNVKLSEHARFCMESINVPILYDNNDERKSIYEKEYTDGVEVPNNNWLNSKLTTRNIPTKLITVKYNDTTIENYE
jgi:hypothetical protein